MNHSMSLEKGPNSAYIKRFFRVYLCKYFNTLILLRRREHGVVCSLREGFGFLRCVERENTMFFHFAEVLRLGHELSVGDEVS